MSDIRPSDHWGPKPDFLKSGPFHMLIQKVAEYLELDDATELAAPPKARRRRRRKRLTLARNSITGEIDSLAEKLPSDFSGLIIDAGSNIGTSAIGLASLFPTATIIAIEPSTRNMAMLRANTAHLKNIRPIHAALAAQAGQRVTLRDRGLGKWGLSPAHDDRSARMEEAQTISIDAIRDLYPYLPLGLVRIDIAGAEKDLFENAADQFADIPLVFAELHEDAVPGCEAALRKLGPNRIEERFGGQRVLSQLIS